jgi:hypothetical protein
MFAYLLNYDYLLKNGVRCKLRGYDSSFKVEFI